MYSLKLSRHSCHRMGIRNFLLHSLFTLSSAFFISHNAYAITGSNAHFDSEGMFPQTGIILFKKLGDAEFDTEVACTGTLIRPNVVLSAGHCIAIGETLSVLQLPEYLYEHQAWFTLDPKPLSSVNPVIVPVKYQVGHPGLKLSPGGFTLAPGSDGDVGVYVLNDKIEDVPMADLPSIGSASTQELRTEQTLLVGYTPFENTIAQGEGVSTGVLTEYQRRYGQLPVSRVTPNYIKLLPKTVHSGVNGCEADSGGPLYLASDFNLGSSNVILGVWSGSGTTQATDICSTEGHTYTRLDTPHVRDFLEAVLDAVGDADEPGNPCHLGYANHVLGDPSLCELTVE